MSTVEYASVYQNWAHRETPAFIEESALIELLADNVLFMGSGAPDFKMCRLLVNCNDLFYWGTADYEDVGYEELEPLYKAWKEGPANGVSAWCCCHRGLRPQAPIETKWREAGLWSDELEALPKPEPS